MALSTANSAFSNYENGENNPALPTEKTAADTCEFYEYLISGVVFHDRNNNAVRDIGEPVIEGIRVEINSISQTTDIHGRFEHFQCYPSPEFAKFSSSSGEYETKQIYLSESQETQYIPLHRTYKVRGKIVYDLKRSKLYGGKTGVENIPFKLEPLGLETRSDSLGNFSFEGLEFGNYTLLLDTIDEQNSWQTWNELDSINIDTTRLEINQIQYYSWFRDNKISVQVFFDLNQNGIKEEGEDVVPLTRIIETELGEDLVVDSTGIGIFISDKNTFDVELSDSIGQFTSTSTSLQKSGILDSTDIKIDFGLYSPTSIQIKVYDDRNNNATMDSIEPGVHGQAVMIQPQKDIYWTDSSGIINVQVHPGKYSFSVIPQDYYNSTSKNIEVDLDYRLGLNREITLSVTHPFVMGGRVISDLNENGKIDTWETGLSNVLVTAKNTGRSVRTDANGNYRLELDTDFAPLKINVDQTIWEVTNGTSSVLSSNDKVASQDFLVMSKASYSHSFLNNIGHEVWRKFDRNDMILINKTTNCNQTIPLQIGDTTYECLSSQLLKRYVNGSTRYLSSTTKQMITTDAGRILITNYDGVWEWKNDNWLLVMNFNYPKWMKAIGDRVFVRDDNGLYSLSGSELSHIPMLDPTTRERLDVISIFKTLDNEWLVSTSQGLLRGPSLDKLNRDPFFGLKPTEDINQTRDGKIYISFLGKLYVNAGDSWSELTFDFNVNKLTSIGLTLEDSLVIQDGFNALIVGKNGSYRQVGDKPLLMDYSTPDSIVFVSDAYPSLDKIGLFHNGQIHMYEQRYESGLLPTNEKITGLALYKSGVIIARETHELFLDFTTGYITDLTTTFESEHNITAHRIWQSNQGEMISQEVVRKYNGEGYDYPVRLYGVGKDSRTNHPIGNFLARNNIEGWVTPAFNGDDWALSYDELMIVILGGDTVFVDVAGSSFDLNDLVISNAGNVYVNDGSTTVKLEGSSFIPVNSPPSNLKSLFPARTYEFIAQSTKDLYLYDGANWTNISKSLINKGSSGSTIFEDVIESSNGSVYACTRNKVFRSNGTNFNEWELVTQNIAGTYGQLEEGADGNIYMSTSNYNNQVCQLKSEHCITPRNNGYPEVQIIDFKVDENGWCYLGTTNGLWIYKDGWNIEPVARLSVFIFKDYNQDNLRELQEPVMANQKILILPSNIVSTTDNDGFLEIDLNPGDYTLKVLGDSSTLASVSFELPAGKRQINIGVQGVVEGSSNFSELAWTRFNGGSVQKYYEDTVCVSPLFTYSADNKAQYCRAGYIVEEEIAEFPNLATSTISKSMHSLKERPEMTVVTDDGWFHLGDNGWYPGICRGYNFEPFTTTTAAIGFSPLDNTVLYTKNNGAIVYGETGLVEFNGSKFKQIYGSMDLPEDNGKIFTENEDDARVGVFGTNTLIEEQANNWTAGAHTHTNWRYTTSNSNWRIDSLVIIHPDSVGLQVYSNYKWSSWKNSNISAVSFDDITILDQRIIVLRSGNNWATFDGKSLNWLPFSFDDFSGNCIAFEKVGNTEVYATQNHILTLNGNLFRAFPLETLLSPGVVISDLHVVGGEGVEVLTDKGIHFFDLTSEKFGKSRIVRAHAPAQIEGPLVVKNDGRIYVSADQAIWSFNGNQWTKLKSFESDDFTVTPQLIDYKGDLVVTFGNELFTYDGQEWAKIQLPNVNADIPIYDVVQLINGEYMVATSSGIYLSEGDDWTVFNTNNSDLSSDTINQLCVHAGGTVLAATSQGIDAFQGGIWTNLLERQSIAGFEDYVGYVGVGSIYAFDDGRVYYSVDLETYSLTVDYNSLVVTDFSEMVANIQFSNFVESSDGVIYCSGLGLGTIKSDEYQNWLGYSRVVRDIVYNVDILPNGDLAIASHGGLYIKHGETTPARPVNVDENFAGKVFLDANGNGIQDFSEGGLPGQAIILNPKGVATFSRSDGTFSFNVENGDFSLVPVLGKFEELTYSNADSVISSDHPFAKSLLFGIHRKDTSIVKLWSVAKPTRCGFESELKIGYSNVGSRSENVTLSVNLDTSVQLISVKPTPINIDGNQLTWNILDFAPSETGLLKLTLLIPDFHHIGDTIEHTYSASNSRITWTESASSVITCAYDPNDKTGSSPGIREDEYLVKGEPLNYRIRFQNTGTDTAFNVVIYDTLANYLDISTMKILGSSHAMETTFTEDGNITFRFDNILLPDSNVNELASHGYVVFMIYPKEDLTDSIVIENKAHIVFDVNPAIETNTASNIYLEKLPVGIADSLPENVGRDLFIWPNPTVGEINIIIDQSQFSRDVLRISDISGKIIRELRANAEITRIDANSISEGVYFVSLVVGGHVETTKIVVVH